MDLNIDTPRWSMPLLTENIRYLGAKGGRSSGKSHWFAERLVEMAVVNPNLQWVCIREIQKSLKFSAKKLVEDKIRKLDVAHLFDIQRDEIHRKGGTGIIIFQGMQDHTADSIKSLEGFDGAWVEEAQSLSARSIELLDPTIRKDGSQLWFSWNPDQPTDAVEKLFKETGVDPSYAANDPQYGDDCVLVHVNYLDNPWCPKASRKQASRLKRKDYEKYRHIWLGGYNLKSDAQVFCGHWRVDEFEPAKDWDGPYFGLDFGFAMSETAGVKSWVSGRTLYIEHELYEKHLELDNTAKAMIESLPSVERHAVRADSARPESISYLKRNGIPRIEACKKGKGSVEDGVEFIKSFDEVVIHPRCTNTMNEFALYSYKIDRHSGDILPVIVDAHNHAIDSLRYALEPIMKKTAGSFFTQKRRVA